MRKKVSVVSLNIEFLLNFEIIMADFCEHMDGWKGQPPPQKKYHPEYMKLHLFLLLNLKIN